ncbi:MULTISPECIES: response regulator [unclassified Roseitalea]|uniref:response regulator n=1 Tax=unclassified Roseitalea TaxID=2639107 RepID=UPI00273DDE80|nr:MULTISPECIES: response regulator [unclassified Roseitalea]
MIVEKSSVVRKVARRILAAPDRFVIEAASAGEALAMCEAQMPDCIVVEANPSDMVLEEFVRSVRAMQTDVKPLIVVAMIELDLVRMTKAKRAGADDYLLKPFDRHQLLARFAKFERQAA